jgi:hypothetical protein
MPRSNRQKISREYLNRERKARKLEREAARREAQVGQAD